jgi:RNA polymerase sigma-70 factor (ECF subfamily)
LRAESQIGIAQVELVAEISRSIDEAVEPRLNMNEDAFRLFYERTARSLFAYLLRVSGQRHLADDLLQESYCRLLSAKLPVMDEPQTKNYLFRIATNLLRDRWRRAEDVSISDTVETPAPDQHPEVQTDVRIAFEQLKTRERQLLWLAYVEGANHNEIASATGLRTGSVKLLLFRARRKLAGILRRNPAESREKVNI